MNAKWIVALACGAALALGACSGSAPAPATGNGGTDNGGGTDNDADPAPDERSDAAKAFDTALEAARTAVTNANDLVMAAEDAAAAADTDEARMAAQVAITRARNALAEAVTLAQALASQVPEGDGEKIERLGQAGMQAAAATKAQTDGEAKLRAAEGLTGWPGVALLSRAPPPRDRGRRGPRRA